jgi:uncharacterized protein YdgA (DUF945 family)
MSNRNSPPLEELEERIAIARDNVRQLIEQAAAFSGAEDEERNAERLARQQEELEKLTKLRDALLKKTPPKKTKKAQKVNRKRSKPMKNVPKKKKGPAKAKRRR